MKDPDKLNDPEKAIEHMRGALRITLAACVVMFVLLYFIDPMLQNSSNHNKVQQFANVIEPITAPQILEKVKASQGTPVVMMVYASWCGYCRQVMPRMMKLMRERKEDSLFNVLFVSVDKDMMDLGNYLVKEQYDMVFTPYIAQTTNFRKFKDVLQRAGLKYDGRIPFIAIIDGSGSVRYQGTGNVSLQKLKDGLFLAMAPQ